MADATPPPHDDDDEATQPRAAAAMGKRKRRVVAQVSTAPRLQPKTLLASTRDELREIQTELMELADARRKLLARDKSGNKSFLQLLPPKA